MLDVFHPYSEILESDGPLPEEIILNDHINGFDSNYCSTVLDQAQQRASNNDQLVVVQYVHPLESRDRLLIQNNYPNLDIKWNWNLAKSRSPIANPDIMKEQTIHPPQTFDSFLCSFNGTPHVGRMLLVSMIYKMGWYDPEFVSKNFLFTNTEVENHIHDLSDNPVVHTRLIGQVAETFAQSINSFDYSRMAHAHNRSVLSQRVAGAFVHLVSETMATSRVPFYTEKFFHSIVNRGLFVCYAQPGYHRSLETIFGFRLYKKLFDYDFDLIVNPVSRLIRMAEMLGKFNGLSSLDWHDLYQLEIDTIEYNHDHFYSRKYLDNLI